MTTTIQRKNLVSFEQAFQYGFELSKVTNMDAFLLSTFPHYKGLDWSQRETSWVMEIGSFSSYQIVVDKVKLLAIAYGQENYLL